MIADDKRLIRENKIYNEPNMKYLKMKEIPRQMKTEVYKAVVEPTLTYGSEL